MAKGKQTSKIIAICLFVIAFAFLFGEPRAAIPTFLVGCLFAYMGWLQ